VNHDVPGNIHRFLGLGFFFDDGPGHGGGGF
jgi:hypothetical protein